LSTQIPPNHSCSKSFVSILSYHVDARKTFSPMSSQRPSTGLSILLILAALSLAPIPTIVPASVVPVVIAGAVIYIASINSTRAIFGDGESPLDGHSAVCLPPLAALVAVSAIYGYLKTYGQSSLKDAATFYILLVGACSTYSTFRPLLPLSIFGSVCNLSLTFFLLLSVYFNACGTVLFAIVFTYQAINHLPVSTFQTAFVLFFAMFIVDCVRKTNFPDGKVGSNILGGTILENMVLYGKSLQFQNRDTLNLGLKDVVIPGMFVSLMLRYDLRNAESVRIVGGQSAKNQPTPFFHVSFFSLLCGYCLQAVMTAMEDSPMPIFLFTFPSCVCSTIAFAVGKQQFFSLLKYSDSSTGHALEFKEK
jgi:hypothetical protein